VTIGLRNPVRIKRVLDRIALTRRRWAWKMRSRAAFRVGNFEPSYTEYITDYLLAEVWLPGEDGFLVHTTKGAHQNQIIKGQKAAK